MQAKFTPTLFEKDICSMSQVDPYAELRAGVRSVVTLFALAAICLCFGRL